MSVCQNSWRMRISNDATADNASKMIESLRDSGFCVRNYQCLQPTLFGRIEVMMRFGGRGFTVGRGFAF